MGSAPFCLELHLHAATKHQDTVTTVIALYMMLAYKQALLVGAAIFDQDTRHLNNFMLNSINQP